VQNAEKPGTGISNDVVLIRNAGSKADDRSDKVERGQPQVVKAAHNLAFSHSVFDA
jgi:hypothetical protein